MLAANLNRIELQLLRNLVDLHFERITRLRRAVPTLWTTRWFICKSSQSLKLVARPVISNSLQRTRVESTRNSVAAVCPAIEIRFKMHRGDRAVVLHACLDLHQHRMAPAMTVKNFFARQRDFHRTTSKHGQLANYHFVIE